MLTILAAVLLAQAHVHDPPAVSKEPPPALKGSMIDLAGSKAYVAKPAAKAKGGVLLVHEWWGLTDWIKHMADELGGQGYLALAVDLYGGKVTSDPKEAAALMQARDEGKGDKIEEAGVEWLKANGGAKVATIGWCFGGGQSLQATLNDPKDVAATVIYYGQPVTDLESLKTLRGPVLGIWGNKDGHFTPEVVKGFDKALTDAGVKHEFHAYDAGHGFANPSSGAYTSEAAKDAWEKTLAFLKTALQ
jgi:carboxymethylenebutenolidase